MDLIELLRKPEGKTLELKRDLSSPNPFLRSVVAFSNTSGGTILIGVEDRTRNVRGVADPIALGPYDEAYADAVRRHRRTRNSRVSRVREPSKSDIGWCQIGRAHV